MVSALKSLLFFLHKTAVMMRMMTVTTAMGANTAAMIHRLLGGFFTTAVYIKKIYIYMKLLNKRSHNPEQYSPMLCTGLANTMNGVILKVLKIYFPTFLIEVATKGLLKKKFPFLTPMM